MEVQLQEIINKIKTDGVNTAEGRAKEIIQEAENKARDIIEKARTEAAQIVSEGKAEAERFEKASISSIEQAGRNTLLSFKVGVTDALSNLVKQETAKAYDSQVLKTLIPETVKNCAKTATDDDLAVVLSQKDCAELQSSIIAALKDQLKNGIEVKASDDVANGFKVGMKDGSAYYDFSAEAVATIFSNYLNPKVAQILNSVAKD